MIPQEAKLLDLLSNRDVTFFIPPYQRNYEWSDDQCKVFLEDVRKTYESNLNGKATEHFFGSVTYVKNKSAFGQPDRLVLIDGQQRITTTMLFLVALRDIINDANIKETINNDYLKNEKASGDTEYKIKLKQVETDWDIYRKLIIGEELTEKEKDSAIYRNYQYFFNKLIEMETGGHNLTGIIEEGLDKFSVVTIELEPDKNKWENPQEIFESMNSLGKPLSLADLVRNYLLLGLDPDTQNKYYKDYWMHIEKAIPQQVSGFIRDYMQMVEGRPFKQATESNYKELYSQFKEVFADEDAKDILSKLSELAPYYSYIISEISSGDKTIDAILSDLRRVSVATANSFLLAIIMTWKENRFTSSDVRDILESFKIYCLRRRIIGITSAENKVLPTFVKKIDDLIQAKDKEAKTFEILAQQENNMRLPNDVELSRELRTMNFFNFKYCKFFLALIEEKITKSRPDLSESVLQNEHIMPQTLNDTWRKELGPDHERIHQEYVNTIGNMTLIRHNQELGNKPFKEKKDIYENNAGLQIAKTKIIENKKWTEKEIKERMDWIIDYLLVDTLPIPNSMRKTNNYLVKEKKGKSKHLSFLDLQLIGEDINYVDDNSIVAHVVGDKEVEFEGKVWKLSPLTKEIKKRKGTLNQSGKYQGAQYWEFDGIKLADVM